MQNNPPFDFKKALLDSAQAYFRLLDKTIVLKSDEFKYADEYKLKFYKSNFLHLTGLETGLSPDIFFEQCYNKTINKDNFNFGKFNDKKTVKRKLKNLITIDKLFSSNVFVQECFVKNKISCKIATSDGKCTLGFVDARQYLRPQTLLDKNRLANEKPIYLVEPFYISNKNE